VGCEIGCGGNFPQTLHFWLDKLLVVRTLGCHSVETIVSVSYFLMMGPKGTFLIFNWRSPAVKFLLQFVSLTPIFLFLLLDWLNIIEAILSFVERICYNLIYIILNLNFNK